MYQRAEDEIEAANIVLATGSQPLIPAFIQPGDPFQAMSRSGCGNPGKRQTNDTGRRL
jgi:hypothetical protein